MDSIKPLPKVGHHLAIVEASELGKLIKAIDEDDAGNYCTIEALKLIPRIFLRLKEIRVLKWSYVDFDDGLIRITEEDMKRSREHLAPLASQVVEQLKEV